MNLAIKQCCGLCGHAYDRLFDDGAMEAHMASAHNMRFEPGDIRQGRPPRWIEASS